MAIEDEIQALHIKCAILAKVSTQPMIRVNIEGLWDDPRVAEITEFIQAYIMKHEHKESFYDITIRVNASYERKKKSPSQATLNHMIISSCHFSDTCFHVEDSWYAMTPWGKYTDKFRPLIEAVQKILEGKE